MKALTIWQPWASLIVEGFKPFEFRGWAAPASIVGQRIVIHAAKRPMKAVEIRDIMEYVVSDEGRRDGIGNIAFDLLDKVWNKRVELPFSAALGTAKLGNPIETSAGRYAWPMLDVDKFPVPLAATGAQGFWNWKRAT